jgi:predicted dehydrogenase
MSISEEECDIIAKACVDNDTIVAVCHVLRHYPPAVKIRDIVKSGVIGEVIKKLQIELNILI